MNAQYSHEPSRCTCAASPDSLSTYHGAKHDGVCKHSELTRTMKRYKPLRFKRLPGTRGVTVVLDGER